MEGGARAGSLATSKEQSKSQALYVHLNRNTIASRFDSDCAHSIFNPSPSNHGLLANTMAPPPLENVRPRFDLNRRNYVITGGAQVSSKPAKADGILLDCRHPRMVELMCRRLGYWLRCHKSHL
jgi:hypothetical protein